MKVVVIGSGIVGANAAYHLAKKNNIEVIMVDKEHEGNATSAGAGIVCPWISRVEDNEWYEIAKGGARYYPKLISQLENDEEYDVGYKKVGALSVSSDSKELEAIEQRTKDKQKEAPEMGDIIRINAEEARKLFPPLNKNLEAIYLSGAARVDGRLLRTALKRAALKHGAKLVNGLAELIHDNGQVIGVMVNGETIRADSIIVSTGAWAPSLLEPIGIELKVEPQRGQIAHIRLPDVDTSNWPVILPQSSHYMLAFNDSKVVAGATRETGSGFEYRTTIGGISEVMSEAMNVAPGISNGELQEVRVGFRPMGPDILPLLGPINPFENVIMANGLGASGLTMGPYVGKLAASIAINEETDLDLTPYNPMRAIAVKNRIVTNPIKKR
ncbi:NAD(P)/FAD-dependent oxidoreductase [Virgibacillus ndiopensis]|uniref:NAD(P)/FAD-dependent oxidoreductase n=1 Tax=Virgibacillus ndiopensis TaxID=2004408 RepID=UPI000C08D6A0|nr:FAD-binding oxidoreductase [Virgibacillus ndiopensis]